MYDNEYMERAYQYWKKEKNGEYGVTACETTALAAVLNYNYSDITNNFEKRYEAEQDSLEKIYSDAADYPFDVDLLHRFIDRTVRVMERDSNE